MYTALVARIHTRELPGSDRIQLGTCCGYQVIVGKDVQDGQLGLFFEAGGQLSEGFAENNDLIRRKDENGNPVGGYFENNRRVKALKMRGAKSEGFWIPLTSLSYLNSPDKLVVFTEGDQFCELAGYPICNKYLTPETLRRSRGRRVSRRGETPMFRKHVETDSLRKCIHLIPGDAILYLTEKLHGTSGRFGCVLEEWSPRGFREKLSYFVDRLLRMNVEWRDWRYLNGSRNVILERGEGRGFYGAEVFRDTVIRNLTLRKGEVIYFEIVGDTETGQPIMNPQDTSALKDKEIENRFGRTITYNYGCAEGQCKVYVYRITMTNEDGEAVEYSWPQVVERCKELSLKTVPQVARLIYSGDAEELLKRVNMLVNGSNGTTAFPSGLDPSHPSEGVVVRYESEHGVGWLKHKSWVFGVLEGYLKDSDSYVDMEEAA